jgi:hypothetical protein
MRTNAPSVGVARFINILVSQCAGASDCRTRGSRDTLNSTTKGSPMDEQIRHRGRAKPLRPLSRLGCSDRELIIRWFTKGYMTGHAAHTRWANKRHNEWREVATTELKAVEREIGVPSKALKMIYQSSIKDANAPNG